MRMSRGLKRGLMLRSMSVGYDSLRNPKHKNKTHTHREEPMFTVLTSSP